MIRTGYSPKHMNEAIGAKNTSGGKVLSELTYGNISLVYETYYHSGMQKRIVLYSGSSIEMTTPHVDNESAVKRFWKECEDYLKEVRDSDGAGLASAYSYHNNHPKVKSKITSLMRKYSDQLSTGKYDPVSGERLDK